MNISGLLVLLLFAVFAVCIMSVLLTGADAYRRLAHRDQESFGRRTVTQYIATKVRQNDAVGAITVHHFGESGVKADGDTLQMLEQLEGEEYCTRIYAGTATSVSCFPFRLMSFTLRTVKRSWRFRICGFPLKGSC